MVFTRTILCCLVAVGILPRSLPAAQGNSESAEPGMVRLDRIGLEHGLSQSTVYAIAQDAQGFMWFGTQDGLNRYDGYKVTVFKHDPNDSNSIAHNRVWSLRGDRKGNLWIGTERGINCYRPKERRFSFFPIAKEESRPATPRSISAIVEDSYGRIWIGSSTGLNRYDEARGTIEPFRLAADSATQPEVLRVQSLCEDKLHNLWVGTPDGLYKISLATGSVERMIHDPRNPNSLSSNNVYSLALDSAGTLWIGTWEGDLNTLDPTTNTLTRLPLAAQRKSSNIYALLADRNGDIWMATFDGVRKYDAALHRVTDISAEAALALYESSDGFVWMGTFVSGVLVHNPQRQRFKSYTVKNISKGNPVANVIFSIVEDRDGFIWLGTFGNGISKFDRTRNIVKVFQHNPHDPASLSSNQVIAMCETPGGEIWIGTYGGGLNRLDKTTGRFTRYSDDARSPLRISHNRISAMYYDEQDHALWVGYLNGALDRIVPAAGTIAHYYLEGKNLPTISTTAVTTITRTRHRGLLVGTVKQGLFTFSPDADAFTSYMLPDSLQAIATTVGIFSVLETDDRTLWVGTFGGGLLRCASGTTTAFRQYTAADGLPSNVIYGLLADRAGNLWLSTNKGISRFTPTTERFKNYDVSDGLQSDEFNQGAYCAGRRGELFFGGVNGFNAFFPERMRDNDRPPPVYITEFKVFNAILPLPDPIPYDHAIELSYAQNFFTFEFVGLNFVAPDKNRYAYMLEGFDSDWHYVSSRQRYAGYTNLDPGTYILRVKAANNDGYWNARPATLVITITPPFWMTWWFRVSGLMLVGAVLAVAYRRKVASLERERLRQQELSRKLIERQEEERRRIAREMHDSLGQDLLFMKNLALLSLKSSVGNGTVQDNLAQISDTASRVLRSVRTMAHDLRPPELDRLGLSETLRSILLKVRESTSMTVTGEIDDVDGLLPPEGEINLVRIVQEALANVIKHAEATECRVAIERHSGGVRLTIKDNGKGFDKYATIQPEVQRVAMAATKTSGVYQPIGIGLSGMMERVRMLNGTLDLATAPRAGTTITIEVPTPHTDVFHSASE